jgi:hypothetical protein
VHKIEAAMASAYAGVWFEPADAQLDVGVTSPASQRTVEEIAARHGLAAQVIAIPVRSTWAQLVAAQHRWSRKLGHRFARPGIQTGLNAQRNAVDVTLSSSLTPRERTTLEHEASTATTKIDVNFAPNAQLVAKPELMTTKCNAFATKEAACNSPLTSGVRINPPVGTSGCTAGPMAIPIASKSETYVLTAGHCLYSGGIGSKWTALNRSKESNEIGPVAAFSRATKGDIGAIRIANPGYWVTTKPQDPVFAETAEWSVKNPEPSYPVEGQQTPAQNAAVCFDGATTGQSCGTVGVTTIERTFEESNGEKYTVEGLVEENGATTLGGDSGGPFLVILSNKSALMEGTLVGGPPGTKDFFEPLAKAFTTLSALNLELLTTANEVRPGGLGFSGNKPGTVKFKSSGIQRLTLANKDIVACESATGSTRTSEAVVKSLAYLLTYSECEAFGDKATVSTAGVLFDASGSIGIVSLKTAIEVHAAKCSVIIEPGGANASLGTVKYSNAGNHVVGKANVSGIEYSISGAASSACGTNKETGKASYEGEGTFELEGGTVKWES